MPTPAASAMICEAQVVRSINGPSIDESATYKEQDILHGYCKIIKNADSFVCIFSEEREEEESEI